MFRSEVHLKPCGFQQQMEKYFCLLDEMFMQQYLHPSSTCVFLYCQKIWQLCRDKLTWNYLVIYICITVIVARIWEKFGFLKFSAKIPSYFWWCKTCTFCELDIILQYLFWGKLDWYEKWSDIWDSVNDKFSSCWN